MFGGCDVTVSNDVVKNKFHFRPQQMVLHKVLEKTNNTTCYTHRVTFLNATSYNIRRLQTWIKRYKPIVLKKKKSSLSQGFSSCGFATHKWVPEPTHVGRENAIPLLLGQDPNIKKLYPIYNSKTVQMYRHRRVAIWRSLWQSHCGCTTGRQHLPITL